MDYVLFLDRFGLVPSDDSLPEIRDLLAQEADAECPVDFGHCLDSTRKHQACFAAPLQGLK